MAYCKYVYEMNEVELAGYLIQRGIPEDLAEKEIRDKHHVDGRAFIDLVEDDVGEMTKAIGWKLNLLDVIEEAKNEAKNKKVVGKRGSSKLVNTSMKTRLTSIESIVTATAFPQNLALLVTAINDGDSRKFYNVVLPLLIVTLILQGIIAMINVLRPSKTAPDGTVQDETPRKVLKLERAVIVVFVAVSLAADAFFIARGGEMLVAMATNMTMSSV